VLAVAVLFPARGALARSVIRPRQPLTGYSRAEFGTTWLDPDGNGCDARNEVLRRDLADVRIRPRSNGCVVESGVLIDPYTGARITFDRGPRTSGEVNVDHVVPLGNAWRSGAAHWSITRRVTFANDPLELLAVLEATNAAKNGSDAPPGG